MTTSHEHDYLIKAHAKGMKIQCKNFLTGEWHDISDPAFRLDNEYRIKPEALRLAGVLSAYLRHADTKEDVIIISLPTVEDSEQELRRLHEVNQDLLEALKMLLSYTLACEGMLNVKPAGQIDIARAAIAKAEEKK
jgi:hypothetical protein